jgi:PAS domain S-box-containing protein
VNKHFVDASRHVPTSRSAGDILHALHEYKIELEIQNEQLRQSQAELEKSRDRYVNFYDFAPVGYFTLSCQGLISEANLTGAALLGVARAALLNRRFASFVADSDNWHRHFLSVINSGRKSSCELQLKQGEGASLYVRADSLLCPSPDGGDASVRIVLTDISESVCTKFALERSEQKFRTLTDAMPQMVWVANPDGRTVYFNQQWLDYTGMAPDESCGHGWFESFHPDDRRQAWDAWRHAMRTNDIFSLECRLRRADGIYRWWLIRAVSLRDESGATVNWFGSCTDITEQKSTEEALLCSLLKLEDEQRAKTRFLAAAGHDLRQPVAAAGMYVYALEQTSPTQYQRELIGKLNNSMEIFAELLNQLLDISKFDAGVVKPQITTFDLAELCEWLEKNYAQTAQAQKLKFHLFISTIRPLIVRSDIGLLKTVLMNLVSNALKFTSSGGVLISMRPRGEEVLIQIWDTGIGMDKKTIPRIFDEFYQSSNQQRNREAGLGLGLSICRRAMSLLGGEISCRSRHGCGSVFGLSLQLVGESREILQQVQDPSIDVVSQMFASGRRVVVIEDDALVADGLVSLLEGLGACVRYFVNAEQAFDCEDIIDADYFIIDYALGGDLTGLQFLMLLQEKQPSPIRAVLFTGETSLNFISSVANSPWPVLHKPLNFAKLAAALR